MNPNNSSVVIIGLGQIGGSLGLALQRVEYFIKIGGYDTDLQRLQKAASFLDFCCSDVDDAFKRGDVIVLATPICEIMTLLKYGFDHFPDNLYSDVGSTKRSMTELAANYPEARYIGGHPMAGTEKAGEKGWSDSLFHQKNYFWIADDRQRNEDIHLIVDMIKAIGSVPKPVSAQEHDRLLATTSHLPLLISLALMACYSDSTEEMIPFIGSGFRSMTRLSGGSPIMGKEILMSNRENVSNELNRFQDKLNSIVQAMNNDDDQDLLEQMNQYQQLYWGMNSDK